jgi:hypothetical protein
MLHTQALDLTIRSCLTCMPFQEKLQLTMNHAHNNNLQGTSASVQLYITNLYLHSHSAHCIARSPQTSNTTTCVQTQNNLHLHMHACVDVDCSVHCTTSHDNKQMILQDMQYLYMHSYQGQAEHCSCYGAA